MERCNSRRSGKGVTRRFWYQQDYNYVSYKLKHVEDFTKKKKKKKKKKPQHSTISNCQHLLLQQLDENNASASISGLHAPYRGFL